MKHKSLVKKELIEKYRKYPAWTSTFNIVKSCIKCNKNFTFSDYINSYPDAHFYIKTINMVILRSHFMRSHTCSYKHK